MKIIFPSNTSDIIDTIRDAIGRTVYFREEDLSLCPYSGCAVDPITNTSILAFCPVCSGVGYVSANIDTEVTAHITWKPTDRLQWVTGGQYFTGDCLLQVSYDYINAVNSADYVVVDDKRLRIKAKYPRGVPDVNRVLIECELEEE